jgi:hypothetical protein
MGARHGRSYRLDQIPKLKTFCDHRARPSRAADAPPMNGQRASRLEMTGLQEAYYWSQIVLTGIAFAAAIGAFIAARVAYAQLEAFKQFELLKILEAQPVRKARTQLWHQVRQSEKPLSNSWTAESLEEDALSVCASFDIVGIMARGRNWKFFTREWAHPICWTYELLEEYIRVRNPNGYHGCRNLYNAAKKHPH